MGMRHRAFLTAYEFARGGDFSKPWNVTTIHTQFMRKDHIPKFSQYKIRLLSTPCTLFICRCTHRKQGQRASNVHQSDGAAIDAGLRPTTTLTSSSLRLINMMMLSSAVNRISRAGSEIGKDQRITIYEGLKSMTEWVAEQYGEQNHKGTLEVGKLADLVILSQNPLQIDSLAIKDIKIVETIKEGTTIYPAPLTLMQVLRK